MNGEIRTRGELSHPAVSTSSRSLVPMQIGTAIVYIEEVGEPATLEAIGDIHPVAPSPQEAFETAGEVLHECIRVVGNRVEAIAAGLRPDEITVEFTLSFEAKGKTSIIPLFVTGEAVGKTGLTVTAVWKKPKASGAADDKEHT